MAWDSAETDGRIAPRTQYTTDGSGSREYRQPAAAAFTGGSVGTKSRWHDNNGVTRRAVAIVAKSAPEAAAPRRRRRGGIGTTARVVAPRRAAAPSRLAFRTAAAIPGEYEQNDERGCRLTWGITRDEPCVNDLGSIITSPNRAIAFPNIYQHRVSPFQLVDKTKPGHRKILALFLVDPAVSKPSTTVVPPQQREWRAAGPAAGPRLRDALRGAATSMPSENKPLDSSMSREEAETYRLELMDERTLFVRENDQKFFAVPFSLCEH
ncbi:hypothetical protein BDV93DRAFT_558490 [Ceratobasidium sp. AG-I]|nr:hypothetical protein BDV93DRAFT_558490 [Ceratobasidium sp. AG-I]